MAKTDRLPSAIGVPAVVFVLCDSTSISPVVAASLGNAVACFQTPQLLAAIQEALIGGEMPAPCDPRKTRFGGTPPASVHLAPKEAEVMDLLARGDTYIEISSKLGIGYSTVRTYVRRIYLKLGVHSRGAAVAKQIGLTDRTKLP